MRIHLLATTAALLALSVPAVAQQSAQPQPPAQQQTNQQQASQEQAGQQQSQELQQAMQQLQQAREDLQQAQQGNAPEQEIQQAKQDAEQALQQIQQAMQQSGRQNPEAEQAITQAQETLQQQDAEPTLIITELEAVERRLESMQTASATGDPGAEIVIDPAAPQVAVQEPQEEVIVQQPEPQVTVRQPPPQVEVTVPEPQVTVQMPEPNVQVQEGQPEVSVSQAEPEVTVQESDPQVSVEETEPQVMVEQAEPQVTVEQAEPEVAVQTPGGSGQEDDPATMTGATTEPETGSGGMAIDAEALDPVDEREGTAATPEPETDTMAAVEEPAEVEAPTMDLTSMQSLIGQEAVGTDGEQIGEVTDVLVSPSSGQPEQVVVSFGGFLGIGEKQVAIPWSDVQADPASGGVMVSMTEEAIRSAENFDPASMGGSLVSVNEQ